jgi:hypothetical protein
MFVTTIFEDLNVLLPCIEGKFVHFYKGKQTPNLKIRAYNRKDHSHVFIAKARSHNYIRIIVHIATLCFHTYVINKYMCRVFRSLLNNKIISYGHINMHLYIIFLMSSFLILDFNNV